MLGLFFNSQFSISYFGWATISNFFVDSARVAVAFKVKSLDLSRRTFMPPESGTGVPSSVTLSAPRTTHSSKTVSPRNGASGRVSNFTICGSVPPQLMKNAAPKINATGFRDNFINIIVLAF